MFKTDIRSYTKQALEKRGVEVLLGELVARSRPTRVTLKSGTSARGAHARLGCRLQASPIADSLGHRAARRATGSASSRISDSPTTPRCSPSATSRGSPTRRRNRYSRSSARSRSSPASSAGDEHRASRRRQGDGAVRVSRQGHDGDDRPRRGGRPVHARTDDQGQDSRARVGHRPSRAALHRRGPSEGGRRLEPGPASRTSAPGRITVRTDRAREGRRWQTRPPSSSTELARSAATSRCSRRSRARVRFDLQDGASRPSAGSSRSTRATSAVSRRNATADCVVRTDKALFDEHGERRGRTRWRPCSAARSAVEGDSGAARRSSSGSSRAAGSRDGPSAQRDRRR